MSTETATFAIALEDQTSGPADDAAAALEQLKGKLEADTKALRSMQAAMRNLKGSTSVNVAAFRQLRDQIDAQKASIATAQQRYLELGGSFRSAAKDANTLSEAAGGGMGKLLGASKKLPGPLGRMADGLEDLTDLVAGGGAAAAGMVIIAAAAVILVVALGAAAIALTRYGIAQADARRSELLRLEAATTMNGEQAASAAGAEQLQKSLDRVTQSVALGRGDIEGYARSLYRAGLRGAALDQALEATAITASVLGDEAAKSFARQAAGAHRAGRSVTELADNVRSRLGGIARRQMLSLDVQSRKLSEHLSALFGDLPIEGFLELIGEVVEMFSQASSTGRALKAIVESIFGPILEDVGVLGPIVKRFFQGIVIGALLGAIAVLRLRNWFRDTFGDPEILKGIDALQVALYGGLLVVSLLAGAALTLAAALAIVTLFALVMAAVFLLPVIAVGLLVYAFVELYEYLYNVDWAELGTSLINGLVRGLEAGRDLVINTVRGIADSATAALEGALGIASPSRVFAELGRQIPAGLAVGIEAEAATAESAVDDMAPTGISAAGSGSSMSISVGDIHISGVAGDDPGAVAGAIRDELVRMLEELGVQLGGGEQPA